MLDDCNKEDKMSVIGDGFSKLELMFCFVNIIALKEVSK